jgi:hypothetical protein
MEVLRYRVVEREGKVSELTHNIKILSSKLNEDFIIEVEIANINGGFITAYANVSYIDEGYHISETINTEIPPSVIEAIERVIGEYSELERLIC